MNPEDAISATITLRDHSNSPGDSFDCRALLSKGCVHAEIDRSWYSYPLSDVKEIVWYDGFPRNAI